MSRFQFWAHRTSGEVWAVRLADDDDTVTGACGPLAEGERDEPLPDYNYDRDDAEWLAAHEHEFNLWEPTP
jgi:hypothetical protein